MIIVALSVAPGAHLATVEAFPTNEGQATYSLWTASISYDKNRPQASLIKSRIIQCLLMLTIEIEPEIFSSNMIYSSITSPWCIFTKPHHEISLILLKLSYYDPRKGGLPYTQLNIHKSVTSSMLNYGGILDNIKDSVHHQHHT